MAGIEKVLAEYGFKTLEEANELCLSKNINVEHIINKPRGAYAYTIVDLGTRIGLDTAESIRSMSDVLRVSVI